MPELSKPNLNGVAEMLLLPLYGRALESQRPAALNHDEKAVALAEEKIFLWAGPILLLAKTMGVFHCKLEIQ